MISVFPFVTFEKTDFNLHIYTDCLKPAVVSVAFIHQHFKNNANPRVR